MIPSPEAKTLTLSDLAQIIYKRIIVVLVVVILAIAFVVLYDISPFKPYVARTTIQIKRNPLRLLDPRTAPLEKESWGRGEFETYLELLKSHFMAERVIKKMDLDYTPKEILSMIDVKQIRGTNMAMISVRGKDPVQVKNIADTWVEVFIQRELARRSDIAQSGEEKLETQLSTTLEKLKVSEQELNDFLSMHGDIAEQEALIDRLKKKEERLEEQIIEDSARYGDNHHKIIGLQLQLKELREQLKQETTKYLKSQDTIATYNVLKKKNETYKKIYEELITKSKQLGVAKGLAVSDIKVIDVAQIPIKPEAMPMERKTLIIFGSLFFGIFLCFLLEFIDTALNTSDEVELIAKLPFLGYIPLIKGKEKDRYLASNKDQFSITAEAFRNIKVSLLFSSPENKKVKSILVTSAKPKEGKSLVASNLATVFAQEGKPTLLIDADMRGGQLAGTFDIDITPGMSEILSGNASVDEAIKQTQIPNLSLIPSGVHIPNPIDILNTENFEKLFEAVSSRFEKIVVDIPSVLTFNDSLFWERQSDYLVMVIKSGSTQLKSVEEAKKKFIGKVSLAGAVLNKTEITKDLKYYLHYFEKTMKNVKKGK